MLRRLTNKHSRGHMARAVMEGVTYSLKESLNILDQLQVPVKEIRVSGGGSKSPLWKQIMADAFGQKACTINAEQGPAFGVALLAAVGNGNIKISKKRARRLSKWSRKRLQKSHRKKYTKRDFPCISHFTQHSKIVSQRSPNFNCCC